MDVLQIPYMLGFSLLNQREITVKHFSVLDWCLVPPTILKKRYDDHTFMSNLTLCLKLVEIKNGMLWGYNRALHLLFGKFHWKGLSFCIYVLIKRHFLNDSVSTGPWKNKYSFTWKTNINLYLILCVKSNGKPF